MRFQSKASILYMFRNFARLFFVTLPVSVLLAFCANPNAEADLFVKLVSGAINEENCFDEFAKSFTVLRFVQWRWWVILVALFAVVALAYTMCVMVVKIDRHMRIGNMPVLPLKRAARIFPMMLLFTAGWIVVVEVFMLIIVGIVYMLRILPSPELTVGIGLGLTVVARAILTYFFGLLIITLPLKYSDTYRFNVALSYSARTMVSKNGKLILFSLFYVFARYAVMAIAYFARPLDFLIYTVSILMALTYVPCFAFKQYYDDVGGERRDVSQIMFG